MAGCQSRMPGAEYRVERCPSSAPLWSEPAHTEHPLSQYPLLLQLPLFLLIHLSSFLNPALKWLCVSSQKQKRAIVSIKWHVQHTINPAHMFYTRWLTRLPLLLSSSLYVGWSHRVLWLVLWQCERHRKERPRFLWCSCCCGPEEIRTHTHGCTRRHEQTITTQTRAACANAPSLSTSPADRLPRGLALINSPARPHLRLLSHILVCSLLNNLHSPVQLRVFKLASLVEH